MSLQSGLDIFVQEKALFTIAICYPFKTLIRYQQKFGNSMIDSIKLLLNQGGLGRFYSGIFYRFMGKSAELLCFSKVLNSIIQQNDQNLFFNFLYQCAAGAFITFTFLPFYSLSYYQQIYGERDGRCFLKQKIKQNGIVGLYHGLVFFQLGQLIGWSLAYPAFYSYNSYRKKKKENVKTQACLYSMLVTYDLISNPFKIMAIERLTNIQLSSYRDIFAKLVEINKGYGWMYRSMDTKLIYSFFRAAFISYIYDYKNLKSD